MLKDQKPYLKYGKSTRKMLDKLTELELITRVSGKFHKIDFSNKVLIIKDEKPLSNPHIVRWFKRLETYYKYTISIEKSLSLDQYLTLRSL